MALDAQAKMALTNPIEMGLDPLHMIKTSRTIPDYKTRFKAAFGTSAGTLEQVTQAIATFERLVVSGDSPYDRFMAGQRAALTAGQQRGLATFTKLLVAAIVHVGRGACSAFT
jgi:cytochrome c peroxidase